MQENMALTNSRKCKFIYIIINIYNNIFNLRNFNKQIYLLMNFEANKSYQYLTV